MLSIVSLLAVAAAAPLVSANAALESPARHVRTTYPYVQQLLKDGFHRSPTFARLMSRLEQTDVIVYVEAVPRLPPALQGRLVMLPRAHDNRYLRIQIAVRGSEEDMIALVAHELQHATEVADAPEVSDQLGFVALYERIGMHSGWHQYDTAEAQEMGKQVRKELV